MGQKNTLLLYCALGPTKQDALSFALKSTLGSVNWLVYGTDPAQPGEITCWDPVVAASSGRGLDITAAKTSFRCRLKKFLRDVQVEANNSVREKYLFDVRHAREIYSGTRLKSVLDRLRTRLDNPDVLSTDTLLTTVFSYRDLEDFDAVISIIEELQTVPNSTKIINAPPIQFHYAFALNK